MLAGLYSSCRSNAANAPTKQSVISATAIASVLPLGHGRTRRRQTDSTAKPAAAAR